MKYNNIPTGTIIEVRPSGVRYNAYDRDGTKYNIIPTYIRKRAHENGNALELNEYQSGRKHWVEVPLSKFNDAPSIPKASESVEVPDGHEEILTFIHSSYRLKPESLVMNELKWKYLIRSAIRGKNIMMTGQSGCGKTMSAKALVNALDRPDFYFNMGAPQDP